MWTAIFKAFSALKAGERLMDVVGWKNTQATSNDVYLILALVVALVRIKFPDFLPDDDILLSVASGFAIVLSAINSYLTRATTYKIGVK